MKQTRGFVLVNALILVAALSAAALYLLSRAEGTRLRAAAAQQAQQLSLYLDAGEALAVTRLETDRSGGAVDHLGESWAKPDLDRELDAGLMGAQIATEMHDLQGRFNLNWLANPQDTASRAAFDALCAQLAIAPQQVDAIVATLASNNSAPAPAGAMTDPVGGPILMLDQLLDLPNMTPEVYARLVIFVTALPGDSALNVNTASPEVLASLLPTSNATALATLVQSIRAKPFAAVDDFIAALPGVVSAEALDALDPSRFSIGSGWFETNITVQLQDRVAHRRAILQRLALSQGTKVAYRLDSWN